jgi:hypothetical protein
MGDVANILGIMDKPPAAGLSREVIDLLSAKVPGELPPIIPTNMTAAGAAAASKASSSQNMVKVGNRLISSEKKARRWAWAPFSSSSRTDGLLLHHWVRSNVEYPDYPYGTKKHVVSIVHRLVSLIHSSFLSSWFVLIKSSL